MKPSAGWGHTKQLHAPGLSAPVTIRYDVWGIPHIQADTLDALFFGNGYAHAADRLWQMDAARRKALGRFAEWVGIEAVAADTLMRRLRVATVSRADYAALSATTQNMCEHYAAGVNAFIRKGSHPPEYALLEETPEPWEGWHCVVVMRQRGLLMGSLWFKLWRAAACSKVDPQHLPLLRYEDGGTERFIVPQGRSGQRWTATLAELAPAIQALSRLGALDATGGGSNSWAINGQHTQSGKPLLAGDPHRAYEIPGMYSQIHLCCPQFDALGLSVPGVPGLPHFGHNAHVAWGVTHAFTDIHDLYIEDFSGQTPGCYRTENGSAPAQHHTETLQVRDAPAVTIDVWQTRHGPLILGDPTQGCGMTLRSMQLQAGDTSLDCLLPMLSAPNITAFYDMMAPWGLIDHNLVAADRTGNVGVLVRARIPIRERTNGWLPVPGWAENTAWRGIIPFARMPREENPASGIVVTANNRTVPDDWPDYICTDCHPATRAQRIHRLLTARATWTAHDLLAVLHDHASAPALEIAQRLLALPLEDRAQRALISVLHGWPGTMDASLLAPTVYYALRQEMTRILARLSRLDSTAGSPMMQVPPGIPPLAQLWWTLPDQLRRNDTCLLGGASWEEVMREAIATVAQNLPPQRWGQAHRPLFVHPLASVFPQHAAHLAPSSVPVSGDGDCVFATGALPQTGLTSTYGPIAKYVWDLSDWDQSRWVVFHGASGNPDSPHYRDQNLAWAHSTLVPAFYSETSVMANTARTLRLLPAQLP